MPFIASPLGLQLDMNVFVKDQRMACRVVALISCRGTQQELRLLPVPPLFHLVRNCSYGRAISQYVDLKIAPLLLFFLVARSLVVFLLDLGET